MQEIKPNLRQSQGDNVIGFPDVFKGTAANDSVVKPIQMQKAEEGKPFSGSRSGGGVSNVTPILSEIQASSELSMEELAKQTEILERIDDNTDTPVASAGGQTPPTTEADIRAKLNETQPIDEEQGDKIIGSLAELNKNSKKTTSLLAFAGAFAGSQMDLIKTALENMWNDMSTSQKVLAGIAVGVAALMMARGLGRLIPKSLTRTPTTRTPTTRTPTPRQGPPSTQPSSTQPKPQTAPPRQSPPQTQPKPQTSPTSSTKPPTPTTKPPAPTTKPPTPTGPKTSVAKTIAQRLPAKIAQIATTSAASGPAAAVVGTALTVASVYELSALALREAGYGKHVDAFEGGVVNFLGFDTEEQEEAKDIAKILMNAKKYDALSAQIDASDMSQEMKIAEKQELREALDNSGDVDWVGDIKERKADRVFSFYENKYGEVDLDAPPPTATTPTPNSATSIEVETTKSNEADMSKMQPLQPPTEPQPAPQVIVKPTPPPDVNVTATLPRTMVPSEPTSRASQARIPNLAFGF